MSDELRRGIRNANVGIAVSTVVLLVGFTLFHDSEGAMEALGVMGLVVALGVLFLLDWRDERAGEKHSGHES